MPVNIIHAAQQPIDSPYAGALKISVTSTVGLIPVRDATVSISYKGMPDSIIETLDTDESGQTEEIELPAPPIELSLEPQELQPYSEYNIEVNAPGYEPVVVSGTEILADRLALQPIQMVPIEMEQAPEETIVIPDHTLYGEYPPKIPEDEIKPMDETGEIVLSRVVIPEYVVVHDRLVLLLMQKIKTTKLVGIGVDIYTLNFIVPEGLPVGLVKTAVCTLPIPAKGI